MHLLELLMSKLSQKLVLLFSKITTEVECSGKGFMNKGDNKIMQL